MLSLYGDKHKGIVIEYVGEPENIYPIEYKGEFEHFDYAEILNNITFVRKNKSIEFSKDAFKTFII